MMRRVGTPRLPPCVRRPVQLRHESPLSGEAYVARSTGPIADLLYLPAGDRSLHARLREKASREYDIPGRYRAVFGFRFSESESRTVYSNDFELRPAQ